MLLSLLQWMYGCIVAEVVTVCAAPCVRFGQFNAFLLLFQIEESKGTFGTTATKRTMEHTSGSAGWK